MPLCIHHLRYLKNLNNCMTSTKPSSAFALLIVFGSQKYNKLTHIRNSPAGSFSFKLRLINHSPPAGTSPPPTPFQQQHTGKWHFAQRWPPHLLAWRSAAPYLKRQTERGAQWDQKTPLQFRHSQCQSRHMFIKASVVLSNAINRNIRHFCWRQQFVWPDVCSELIQCQWHSSTSWSRNRFLSLYFEAALKSSIDFVLYSLFLRLCHDCTDVWLKVPLLFNNVFFFLFKKSECLSLTEQNDICAGWP